MRESLKSEEEGKRAAAGRCIITIDTIILPEYTNDAYIYDTYTSQRSRIE
jgi:hypothetical protein